MRMIALAGVLALMMTAGALGDDVPFAAPTPTPPGQPETANIVSLGDIMGETQLRHIKLWYAGASQNWGLAHYEVDRIVESLRRAAYLYTGIPIEYIKSAADPLAKMRQAVATKNPKAFIQSYSELTTACNACHTAAGVGFIRIKSPTSSPFSDEVFSK